MDAGTKIAQATAKALSDIVSDVEKTANLSAAIDADKSISKPESRRLPDEMIDLGIRPQRVAIAVIDNEFGKYWKYTQVPIKKLWGRKDAPP